MQSKIFSNCREACHLSSEFIPLGGKIALAHVCLAKKPTADGGSDLELAIIPFLLSSLYFTPTYVPMYVSA